MFVAKVILPYYLVLLGKLIGIQLTVFYNGTILRWASNQLWFLCQGNRYKLVYAVIKEILYGSSFFRMVILYTFDNALVKLGLTA